MATGTFGAQKSIKEEGYIFVYLSYDNASNNYVYFDDLNITHTKSNVIQYNEYYPFGLQADKSWTRTNAKNNFLFNGATELNNISGYYDLHYRNYDAAIGRFIQVDPMSVSEMAIYQYAGNNPVMFNDPLGDTKTPDGTGRQLGNGGRAIYAQYYAAAGLSSLADYLEFGSGGGGSSTTGWSAFLYAARTSDFSGLTEGNYQVVENGEFEYTGPPNGYMLNVMGGFVETNTGGQVIGGGAFAYHMFVPYEQAQQGTSSVNFEYDYDYFGSNLPANPIQKSHLGLTYINSAKSSYTKNGRGGYDLNIVITVETNRAFLGSPFSLRNPGLYLEVLAHEMRHGAQLESAFLNVFANESQSMEDLGGFGDGYANAVFNSMISGVGFQMSYLFGSPGQIENDANSGSSAFLPNGYQIQYNYGKSIKW